MTSFGPLFRLAVTAASLGLARPSVDLGSRSRLTPDLAYDPAITLGQVVELSADGTTLAVGDPVAAATRRRLQDGEAEAYLGAVYVFERVGEDAWDLQQILTPIPASDTAAYGRSLALSRDGSVLVVGGELSETQGAEVWTRRCGAWDRNATLVSPDAAAGRTSQEVAMSEDGTLAVVAYQAREDESGGLTVFGRDPDHRTWSALQMLAASEPQEGARVGSSVVMGADGRTIVAGAPFFDAPGNGSTSDLQSNAGAALVFFSDDGLVWEQQATLVSPDAAANDRAGMAGGVAISGDTALVSATRGDVGDERDAGVVHVWRRLGSQWSYGAALTASVPRASERFGDSLAFFGNALLVGSPGRECASGDPACGAAYFFERAGDGAEAMWGAPELVVDDTPRAYDRFGSDVALSADFAVLGARGEETIGPVPHGNVYVFGVAANGAAEPSTNPDATNCEMPEPPSAPEVETEIAITNVLLDMQLDCALYLDKGNHVAFLSAMDLEICRSAQLIAQTGDGEVQCVADMVSTLISPACELEGDRRLRREARRSLVDAGVMYEASLHLAGGAVYDAVALLDEVMDVTPAASRMVDSLVAVLENSPDAFFEAVATHMEESGARLSDVRDLDAALAAAAASLGFESEEVGISVTTFAPTPAPTVAEVPEEPEERSRSNNDDAGMIAAAVVIPLVILLLFGAAGAVIYLQKQREGAREAVPGQVKMHEKSKRERLSSTPKKGALLVSEIEVSTLDTEDSDDCSV